MKEIRLGIVEDNVQYQDVLKEIFDNTPGFECVVVYNDAEACLAGVENVSLDVLLVDIQLPGINGCELTYHLKKKNSDWKVVICSNYDDDEKLFTSLRLGAHGYILKSSSPKDIIASVKDVSEGGAPLTPCIAKRVIQYFHLQNDAKDALDKLSEKEMQILELLALGHLYKEIADKKMIAIDTVKKHCGSIYRKLHVHNRTEAINIYFNHH